MSWAPFLAPGRDAAVHAGRPKPSGGTQSYVVPGVSAGQSASESLTAGRDYYAAWITYTPIVIDQLATEVTTGGGGGSTLRIGFYAADSDWQPLGAPLADSGDIDASTTTVKTYTPSSAIYVPRGRYVSVINCSAATTVRALRGTFQFAINPSIGTVAVLQTAYVARAYAAFPTPGTAWDTAVYGNIIFGSHMIFYRVNVP